MPSTFLNLIQTVDMEWKTLGEICHYSKDRIDASDLTESNYVGVDNLLQNLQGKTLSNYVPSEGKLTRFDAGDVLVGNIRPYLKKAWLSDMTGGTNGDVLVIKINKELSSKILPRYLYQNLVSERFFTYDMQHAKGAKMPRGDKTEIMKFEIPIPSLEIQKRVVEILEKMTDYVKELTTELTTELTLRQKQYAYYRDQLLTFPSQSDSDESFSVRWTTLGKIAKKISSGGTPKTGTSEYYDGEIPWLRTQEVNFGEIWNTGVKITEAGVKNSSAKWIPENCVIVAMYGATVGKIGINKIPMTTNQACANIELDETQANYRYVFHYLTSKYEYIKSLGAGSQTNINAQIVKNLPIPLPNLPTQKRIVDILDKFDKLTSDLTAGLPREIALRQKQYEYWREQLLSFKKE